MGNGTISGPTDAELSSLMEFTFAGKRPIMLPNGERRGFLSTETRSGLRAVARGKVTVQSVSELA
jgi:hypothetical protein